MAVNLTDAQRRALANPDGQMHANTRRSLQAKGLLDAQGNVTDAGRAAASAPKVSAADAKLGDLLEADTTPTTPESQAAVPRDEGVVGRVSQGSMKWRDFLSPRELESLRNAEDLGDRAVANEIRRVAQARASGAGSGRFVSQAARQAQEARAARRLPGLESAVAQEAGVQALGGAADDTLALQRANFPERFARSDLARRRVAGLEAVGATGPQLDQAGRGYNVGGRIVDLARSDRPDQLPYALGETGRAGIRGTAESRYIPTGRAPSLGSVTASAVDPSAGGRLSTFLPYAEGQAPLPGMTGARPAPSPSLAATMAPSPARGPIAGQMTLADEAMARTADAAGTGPRVQAPGVVNLADDIPAGGILSRPQSATRTLGGTPLRTPVTPTSAPPAASVAGGVDDTLSTLLPQTSPQPVGTAGIPNPLAGQAAAFEGLTGAGVPGAPPVPTPAASSGGLKGLFSAGRIEGGGKLAAEAAKDAGKSKIGQLAARYGGGLKGASGVGLAGGAAMVGGNLIERQLDSNGDDEGFDTSDVGQFMSGAGVVASAAPFLAMIPGVGWGAIGALGVGAGLYNAIRGHGEDPASKLQTVISKAQELGLPWDEQDQQTLTTRIELNKLKGMSEDEANEAAVAEVIQAADAYVSGQGQAAEPQMTPELYMALQAQYQKALDDSSGYYNSKADALNASRMQAIAAGGYAPAERTMLEEATNASRERTAYVAWANQLAALNAPTRDMYQQQIDYQNSLASRAQSQQISQALGTGSSSGALTLSDLQPTA